MDQYDRKIMVNIEEHLKKISQHLGCLSSIATLIFLGFLINYLS